MNQGLELSMTGNLPIVDRTNGIIDEIHQQLFAIANRLKSLEDELDGSVKHRQPVQPKFTPDRRRYEVGDEFVDLSRTEAIILAKLIDCAGEPVSVEELCEVLGLDSVEQRLNIKSYVFRLRVKLNSLSRPAYDVQAIRDAGYCATWCA